MKKKVIYIFGAGASKHALPLVKEIPESILSTIEVIKNPEHYLSRDDSFPIYKDKTKREIQQSLLDDLQWLLEQSAHDSVDTVAKKLLLKHQGEELERLKLSLSALFIVQQLKNQPDYRYDAFYASILNGDVRNFPDNISILSWNYDYQFELAYMEYYEDSRLSASQSMLNIVSKFGRELVDPSKFAIYKLNGTAALTEDRGRHYYFIPENEWKKPIKQPIIEKLIENYAAARFARKVFSTLSFSWESENRENSIIQQAMAASATAEVVVIIGYSFHFFNRETDRKLFGNMPKLSKVYIQDKDPGIIAERFRARRDDSKNIEIILTDNVDQFLLPNEL